MVALGIAFVSTLSELFKIPVYWPFLFIYFVWLIVLAIIKHIKHMKKYGYTPKDFSLEKSRKCTPETII